MARHFTFEKEDSSTVESSVDKGFVVTGIKRPILPRLKVRKMSVPGKDGAWDFGNNTYDEAEIVVECALDYPLEKRDILRGTAVFLNTKGNLLFSDETDRYYVGRAYPAFGEEIDGYIATFDLIFTVYPFALSIVSTIEDILLDDDIDLDTDIPLGGPDNYEFILKGPQVLNIDNYGTRIIRPKFIFNGDLDDVTIAVSGKTITYGDSISSQELSINCEDYDAQVDGVDMMSEISGDVGTFLTLEPGWNEVTITGTGINCTLVIEFRPEYY